MNKFRFTLNALAIAAFMLAVASMAQAQATRTWVSGVGDDVNPCSRTAPCKTFAGAISKTADGGEIDCLDPGGFGTVTITKSITIDGGGTFGSILASGTNGVNVNDSASGAAGTKIVQLRNLSINGATTGLIGVNITSAGTVFIENCVIFGFKAGSGRGISDVRNGGSGGLFVVDTTVKNNSGTGILLSGNNLSAIRATIDHCNVWSNGGTGIQNSQQGNFMAIRNTTSNKNGGSGSSSDTGARTDIVNCLFYFNGTGINSDSGADVVVSRTTVTRNSTNGLGFSAGTIKSYGNNEVFQNGGNNGPFSPGGPGGLQ